MAGPRAYAKRKLMANRHHIYLAGGLGRVPRGAVIELAMRGRGGVFRLGWIKADTTDPIVHFGRRPKSKNLRQKVEGKNP